MAVEDPELLDWSHLAGDGWDGLTLGNGASQAVWPSFGYASLFEIAKDPNCPDT